MFENTSYNAILWHYSGGVISHSAPPQTEVHLGTHVKIHFLPLRADLKQHILWLAAAQSTSHMVKLQMGSPLCMCVLSEYVICVCVCVCVRHIFRISTSADNLNESWLFSSRSFPLFIQRQAIRGTGIKLLHQNSVLVYLAVSKKLYFLIRVLWKFDLMPLRLNKTQQNRPPNRKTDEYVNQLIG